MFTVHEVSRMTGVSIRALHHYDKIGLLRAAETTAAGYRLYDDKALERLRHILIYKELAFSLQEIRVILDSPDFEREKALEQQIHCLELKRDHLQRLIDLAREIKETGVDPMNFDAFDTRKMDAYAAEAKAAWGQTAAYREYEKKSAGRTKEAQQRMNTELMGIFRAFGEIKALSPDSPEALALVKKLQAHITQHYYTCTDEILLSLGQMYEAGGDFTANIDKAGGEGTARFACRAIEAAVRRESRK